MGAVGSAQMEMSEPSAIDPRMERAARALWPRQPLRLENATGGLFNRVVRVESSLGTKYLKRLTDTASSDGFPPLPTSAAQRCLVASRWHDLALRASARESAVGVPALLAVLADDDLIAMDQAQGDPLYDMLRVGSRGAEGPLPRVMAWLAVLHALPLEPRGLLLEASAPFKAFKVDLQYTRLLAEMPASLHASAQGFIGEYLRADAQAVHGDLNSRNVLVAANGVSVIDFEQGHFGEGLYDVAYLLSEYVIRDLRAGTDPEASIHSAWNAYCGACAAPADSSAQRRFRVHTAFQTLYRLAGPSRTVWTGHLDDAAGQAVRRWSLGVLAQWLQ
ncbi:hypothetical protein D5041_03030 [Verminephrobacter aporrectodeae subsp. tuberculatae]|nr:hypothetical protein [Verminephrobacter aporrectodeae subsp. tuberculatae]MCW5288075.1 hypothetical protein [Verminephrobacter aporrectodeae subsp. tuberculatae]